MEASNTMRWHFPSEVQMQYRASESYSYDSKGQKQARPLIGSDLFTFNVEKRKQTCCATSHSAKSGEIQNKNL